ncbi:hypothetical protein EYZ11_007140 [Aspergillus tanneri]|uniref:Peptide hydrolase n=1 Tax=Aspergillus tanneri TaxID=1220188 RepID=A0A4S3JDQ4_9EURO|nr:hypothetical protein EYZ11_007140 [Aspergillus tanneri]
MLKAHAEPHPFGHKKRIRSLQLEAVAKAGHPKTMGRPEKYEAPAGKPSRSCLTTNVKALLAVAAVLLLWKHLLFNTSRPEFSYEELQDFLLNIPSAQKAREWSSYYTWGSHFPGQGLDQAQWTQTKWSEFGIAKVEVTSHSVYLSRPQGQRVALLDLKKADDQVVHEVSFIENDVPPGGAERPFIPAFFAWSARGNVTAEYVYANFGLDQDYEDLARAGINVEGKIVIIKLTFNSPLLERLNATASRFTQIASATKAGAIGVLAYTDTQGDDPYTEANGYLPFPDGPARPPSMIQRGTIGVVESSPNDDEFRATIPTIPAIPISYADAAKLLRALNSRGPAAADFNERWAGGGLGYMGVQYNVGPSSPSVVIHLSSNPEIQIGQVHNVMGTIEGSIKDEIILLGNHRDTWGPGAGDSHSGSSALNEVVRAFGAALRKGWKPLRTIVFASWEGEEVGRVGSRSWLQENTQTANTSIAAYLNVVEAAAGARFHAQASPLLSKAILEVTDQVLSPNQTISRQTVLDVWGGDIRFGTAGDSILFQGCACLPSSDFGFLTGPGDPVFPYHSMYDTLEYMDKYGDPTWEYHVATAKVWGLLAARLAETPVLSFNVTDYAIAMKKAANSLETLFPKSENTFLKPLQEAIEALFPVAMAHDSRSSALLESALAQRTAPWLRAKLQTVNQKYMYFERIFCRDLKRLTKDTNHLFVPSTPYYVHKRGFPHLEMAIKTGNTSQIESRRPS